MEDSPSCKYLNQVLPYFSYSNKSLLFSFFTQFDALIPGCEIFKEIISNNGSWQEAFIKAVEAADQGCKNTQHFKPL